MIFIFWFCSALLFGNALLFILPFLPGKKAKLATVFFFGLLIYPLYVTLGAPQQLENYYSGAGTNFRLTQDKMRPLFSQLKKQQGRLRLRLNANADDTISKALLLELLGVEALYREDHALALKFWEGSLTLLENTKETDFIQKRILGLKKHVEAVQEKRR